jgi:hypothetical protein
MVRVLRRITTAAACALTACAVALPATAPAATTPALPAWVPDGPVQSMVTIGNTEYIGGSFDTVGPDTGSAAVLSASTGAALTPYSQITFRPGPISLGDQTGFFQGTVYASIPDGSGGYYVGGEFSYVDGVARSNLAHIEADGTLDPNFAPKANGDVKALALSGSTLYVGGTFSYINGLSRPVVAALNATTGKPSAWTPRPLANISSEREVDAIAVDGSTVYVGGFFDKIGGQSRKSVAALSASTAKALAWDPEAGNPNFVKIDGLAISGAVVYLAGQFLEAGGQPRGDVAAVRASDGVATSWDPTPIVNGASSIRALLVTGSAVWVGGDFHLGNGQETSLAALDPTTGAVTSASPTVDGEVDALALDGSTLYLGGGFTSVDGQARQDLAAIDLGSGTVTPWNPNPDPGGVSTVAASGSTVFAGGSFKTVGGVSRDGLAAIDLTTGLPTAWAPQLTGAGPSAMATNGSTIYIYSRWLTAIGGEPVTGLGAIDVATGQPTGWAPAAAANIYALAATPQTVYVVGNFQAIGGQARTNIAALDATTGAVTAWNPGSTRFSAIFSVAVSGSTVYAGGNFTEIGGQTRDGIAALDAGTGEATAWNPVAKQASTSTPLDVQAIVPDGPNVYVGGQFTGIGGAGRANIAELSATTGKATTWNPGAKQTTGYSSEGEVHSIAVGSDAIYAAGIFTQAGGVARSNIAALSPTTGRALSWNPALDPNGDSPVSVAVAGSTVAAGGGFRGLGPLARPGFAEFAAP